MTNQPLGAHGRPVKVLVDGRPLFLCCKGCLYKVQQDPLAWLAKADRLRARK